MVSTPVIMFFLLPLSAVNFSGLSQVDLVKREGAAAQQQVVRIAEQLNDLHDFQQTFWVSALRTQGVTKLKDFLLSR